MLGIFLCSSWPFVILLWRNVYLDLLPIFWFGCFFFIFILSCMSCLYILEINPLSVTFFAKSISHSEDCLVYCFLCCAKAFTFNPSHPGILFKGKCWFMRHWVRPSTETLIWAQLHQEFQFSNFLKPTGKKVNSLRNFNGYSQISPDGSCLHADGKEQVLREIAVMQPRTMRIPRVMTGVVRVR